MCVSIYSNSLLFREKEVLLLSRGWSGHHWCRQQGRPGKHSGQGLDVAFDSWLRSRCGTNIDTVAVQCCAARGNLTEQQAHPRVTGNQVATMDRRLSLVPRQVPFNPSIDDGADRACARRSARPRTRRLLSGGSEQNSSACATPARLQHRHHSHPPAPRPLRSPHIRFVKVRKRCGQQTRHIPAQRIRKDDGQPAQRALAIVRRGKGGRETASRHQNKCKGERRIRAARVSIRPRTSSSSSSSLATTAFSLLHSLSLHLSSISPRHRIDAASVYRPVRPRPPPFPLCDVCTRRTTPRNRRYGTDGPLLSRTLGSPPRETTAPTPWSLVSAAAAKRGNQLCVYILNPSSPTALTPCCLSLWLSPPPTSRALVVV